MEPIAITVAGLEPEIVEKKAQARTVAIAKPPGRKPTKLLANFIILIEVPAWIRKLPVSIKKGIAIIGKLSIPVNIFWAMISIFENPISEKKEIKIITLAHNAKDIGVPVNKIKKSIDIKIIKDIC